jgi:aryl-alcohol dehydrogenase-like predicted oxidoreductase
MRYIALGDSDIELSVLGYGTGTGFKPDGAQHEKHLIKLIHTALENDINWIDTAESYFDGYSESVVGKVLVNNTELKVSTKFSPQNAKPKELREALEGSLRRLKREYVDIYNFHWPNTNFLIEKTFDVLLELKEEGKIRSIGVSNFSRQLLEKIHSFAPQCVVAHQFEYNLFNRLAESELFSYHKKHAISNVGYSPIKGLGSLVRESPKSVLLENLAAKYNVTPHLIALNFLTSISPVNTALIMSSTKADHISQNIQAFDFCIEEEDVKLINDEFHLRVEQIEMHRIKLINGSDYPVYETVQEAQDNHIGLMPGPHELAKEYQNGNMQIPVKVKPIAGTDYYQLVGGMVRYWGWYLAFEGKRKVKAVVLD